MLCMSLFDFFVQGWPCSTGEYCSFDTCNFLVYTDIYDYLGLPQLSKPVNCGLAYPMMWAWANVHKDKAVQLPHIFRPWAREREDSARVLPNSPRWMGPNGNNIEHFLMLWARANVHHKDRRLYNFLTFSVRWHVTDKILHECSQSALGGRGLMEISGRFPESQRL